MRTTIPIALALLIAGCSRQPSRPMSQSEVATPASGSAESEDAPVTAAMTTNDVEEKQVDEKQVEEKQTLGVKPLTSEQQEQLLNSRLDGGMGHSFSQFANVFLAMSRIHLKYG